GEIGERGAGQQQLDGAGTGARGHVLPGDRGDGAVAGGVPQRGRRQRKQGGGEDGGAAHTGRNNSATQSTSGATAPVPVAVVGEGADHVRRVIDRSRQPHM